MKQEFLGVGSSRGFLKKWSAFWQLVCEEGLRDWRKGQIRASRNVGG